MRRTVFAVLIILAVSFFINCKPKVQLKFDKPDLLLTENQMSRLLMDAQLVEGALITNKTKNKASKQLKTEYYEKIFEEHGVTEEIFKENVSYYNQFPETMEKIYDEVLAGLSKRQTLNLSNDDE